MRSSLVLVMLLLVGGCKDKDKAAARDLADRAKDRVVETAGTAKDKLGEVTDKVTETVTDVAERAFVTGKRAKGELAKVHQATHDYELAVDDVGSAEAVVHAARLDKMPSVEVKGVRVGYEEDSVLSLRGTTYAKHFRASWKHGDSIVRVSFYTKDTIDLVAFVELLAKVVPAVETVLR